MSKFLEIGERNNVRLFDGRLAFHYQNIKPEGLALLKKTFTDVAEYYQKNDYKPEGRSTRIY